MVRITINGVRGIFSPTNCGQLWGQVTHALHEDLEERNPWEEQISVGLLPTHSSKSSPLISVSVLPLLLSVEGSRWLN